MNTYFKQFKNKNIKRMLIDKEKVLALEYLIERDAKVLARLQNLKERGKLDLGDKLNKGELEAMFSEVKTDVDQFLGIEGISTPSHGYLDLCKLDLQSFPLLGTYIMGHFLYILGPITYLTTGDIKAAFVSSSIGFLSIMVGASINKMLDSSCYSSLSKKINLKKEHRTLITPIAAHEYTHHLQYELLGSSLNRISFRALKEGHARGVQRKISNLYLEREGNEAYLYGIFDRTVGELKSTYQWLCKKLKTTPNKSLLKQKTSRDSCEEYERAILRSPTYHAIGNTLFYLEEEKKGQGIYKELLEGKLEF